MNVKPHELIAALMAKEGLGALPLAKAMKRPALQPQIHRFVRGEVAQPAASTAVPLATYFDIPLEAIYDEKAATAVARERGIDVTAAMPKKQRAGTKTRENTMSDPLISELNGLEGLLVGYCRALQSKVSHPGTMTLFAQLIERIAIKTDAAYIDAVITAALSAAQQAPVQVKKAQADATDQAETPPTEAPAPARKR